MIYNWDEVSYREECEEEERRGIVMTTTGVFNIDAKIDTKGHILVTIEMSEKKWCKKNL